MSTIDDTRWDLVCRRQPADFLYAVATMGVYCRPGCPSPRPKRQNVRFFRDAEAAEAAGFRACRRCDPKGERAALARAVVADACAEIERAEAIPSLDALARARRLLEIPFPADVPRPHRRHPAQLRGGRAGAAVAGIAGGGHARGGCGGGERVRLGEPGL